MYAYLTVANVYIYIIIYNIIIYLYIDTVYICIHTCVVPSTFTLFQVVRVCHHPANRMKSRWPQPGLVHQPFL